MVKPKYHSQEDFINRLKKLKEISLDPYPHKFEPTLNFELIKKKYKEEIGGSEDASLNKTDKIKIAGRLILFRAMGKNAFAQIQDETGKFQVMFNRDLTKVEGLKEDEKPLKFIEKKIDLGDFIGVEGNIFKTKKGELTVFAKNVTLLCKSLLSLPDKHSGLVDKGIRYHKRWLDLISNKKTINTFILRSKIIKAIREYLDKSGFLEVETPVLQNRYGGAEAKPFITHLNALDQDMFLRISLEIPLKKLIVGGMLKVYELGKVFRNEGIDKTHNPEFTELEAYAAYWDYNDLMKFTENMIEDICLKILGDTKIHIQDKTIDLKAPWKQITMVDSIKEYANIDIESLTDDQIKKILLKKLPEEEVKNKSKGELTASVFEEFVEEHLIEPHHIKDHPIETTPLCKLHRDPKKRKEKFVERFESFVLGKELINAYTELNDPILQRELLEKQKRPLDEDFVEAICQGMPPTAGFGMGIDRLIMILTKEISIRDVIFFPLVNYKNENIDKK